MKRRERDRQKNGARSVVIMFVFDTHNTIFILHLNYFSILSLLNLNCQESPARARAERYPSTQVSASLGSPSAATRLGRPPLSPSGPKTPRRRSRDASSLSDERRSKARRKIIAQEKANKRWELQRGAAEPELADEEMMQLEERLNEGGGDEEEGGAELRRSPDSAESCPSWTWLLPASLPGATGAWHLMKPAARSVSSGS